MANEFTMGPNNMPAAPESQQNRRVEHRRAQLGPLTQEQQAHEDERHEAMNLVLPPVASSATIQHESPTDIFVRVNKAFVEKLTGIKASAAVEIQAHNASILHAEEEILAEETILQADMKELEALVAHKKHAMEEHHLFVAAKRRSIEWNNQSIEQTSRVVMNCEAHIALSTAVIAPCETPATGEAAGVDGSLESTISSPSADSA